MDSYSSSFSDLDSTHADEQSGDCGRNLYDGCCEHSLSVGDGLEVTSDHEIGQLADHGKNAQQLGHTRGKHGKLKKLNTKYKHQEEKEREAMLQVCQHKPSYDSPVTSS
jgi:hypothetical protein